jgi:SAM-dependent methyltransferase
VIFSKDVLFLHVPKTGGMSVTSYLFDVLSPPVYYTRGEVNEAFARLPGVVQILGARHESLPEVVSLLPRYGFSLADFPLILAVLRNPYDLEVSRYHYLRAGHPWDYGPNQQLALTRDFTTFAQRSSLNQHNSIRSLENYFFWNGEIPPNLKIIRFENLEAEIKDALSSIGIESRADFPWRNKSRHEEYLTYYTKEAEEAVYSKFKWVYDAGFYERMKEWPRSRDDGEVEPIYTVPLVGPVHQEGRAVGFAPDCWVDDALRVNIQADEFISEVTVEGQLPKSDAEGEVTLSVAIGGQEAAATFPAADAVSWTIPCFLQPMERPELRLRSSATWRPKSAGASNDVRNLAIKLQRIAFVPTTRVMKRNWDQRARDHPAQNANGDNSQFFERGRVKTEQEITSDLERICADRDPKTMTVLEIGCGAGRMTAHLADIFGDVRAIDVSSEMIALARTNLGNRDNVWLYETSGVDLSPFGDEFFDFCFASGVFHHVPVRGIVLAYLRHVHRTLRNGGLFKFEVQGVPTGVENRWAELGFSEGEMLELADSIGYTVLHFEGSRTERFWNWWTRSSSP